MKITYDSEVDALTLVVKPREPVDRTVDVGEGRFIDLDDEGTVVAVEILDASQGIQFLDLVDGFDLVPLLNELSEHLQTAKNMFGEESDLREALVR